MSGIFLLFIASMLIVWKVGLHLGLDLQGGLRLVLEGKDTSQVKVDDQAMNGVVEVLRGRIDGLGIAEPLIVRKGEKNVVIELPGVTADARAMEMIGDTALLEFVEAEWSPGDMTMLSDKERQLLMGTDGRLEKVKYYDDKGNVITEKDIILRKTVLTGNDLKWVGPGTNEYGQPIVSLEFSPEGSRKFYNATLKLVGKPLAIILDGRIISAPNVNEAISGGRAQISGRFTLREMQDLVIKLKAGSLPVPVEVVEKSNIGPTLGADSIAKSKVAFIIGVILVAVFMIAYYQINGVIAVLALLMYCIFDAAVLCLLGATLTLPGIAGFILSIGMAVDANVIIFERLKEELKEGRTIKNAIDVAFNRALTAILDGNLTTLVGAGVLFWLGTGSVKGFAVTLSVGIMVSKFTAVFITRHLMINVYELKFLKKAAEQSKGE
jgi:preprotein translocase subunit SecD